jgi:glyoxylase-like metal-dependent hydrolase (beta-lactamase superfamily II)
MYASVSQSQRTLTFDRRTFLKGATALAAAGLLPQSIVALATPMSFKQGELEVMVLSDGNLTLPTAVLAPDAPPEERKAALAALGLTGETYSPVTHPVLIKAGNDLILFDTGSGSGFQPTAGKLKESLADAGVTPDAITKVVFTHAHPDHLWGTAAEGALNYPNAAHYAASAEWDFWMDPATKAKFPKEMQGLVDGAQKQFNAIKDKVTMVKAGDEIAAGITVIDSSGHTPGHVSFLVPGGEGLIILGDVVHRPDLYFPHPDWGFGFDAIPDKAKATRKMMLDRAAADKTKVLGYHWVEPVGFVEKKGNAHAFTPAS